MLTLATASALLAQDWNSHLEGLVLDPTGAAVPAASVRLRNVATGFDRRTQTDRQGLECFGFLFY